jgi:hypothetical protein
VSKRVRIVRFNDDWTAIYVNGFRVEQQHSIGFQRFFDLMKFCDVNNLNNVAEIWAGPEDNLKVENSGSAPEYADQFRDTQGL